MKSVILFIIAILFIVNGAIAGDDASGSIPCSVDLSQSFEVYQMTVKDRTWSESLVKNLKYTGAVVHFVRTTLNLKINDKIVQGSVYQAIEKPDCFYVVEGDVMLKIGAHWAYSPGVGGFSMHAPKNMNYIVCLNFQGCGVPFMSSSSVIKGKVSWMGHGYKRF